MGGAMSGRQVVDGTSLAGIRLRVISLFSVFAIDHDDETAENQPPSTCSLLKYAAAAQFSVESTTKPTKQRSSLGAPAAGDIAMARCFLLFASTPPPLAPLTLALILVRTHLSGNAPRRSVRRGVGTVRDTTARS